MEETPLEAGLTFAAPSKRKINKRFVYLVIVILFLLVAFFGFKFLGSSENADINNQPAVLTPTEMPTSTPEPTITESLTPTESPTPTTTKTPTPVPTLNPVDQSTGLDRSDLNVTVQNGNGEVGVAGKASDILKHLGYDVSGTGNADNFDYTGVTVKVKASQSDFLNLLKNDLNKEYTVSASSSNLDNSFSTDALVIIGK